MPFKPEAGLVIRYDFLWRSDQDAMLEHGTKDRPCAIILVSKPAKDRKTQNVVCPITHTPPDSEATAVAIPIKVAKHLRLDGQQMWVKTNTVNIFTWSAGIISPGVTPAHENEWSFGLLPRALGEKIYNQVLSNSRKKSFEPIKR